MCMMPVQLKPGYNVLTFLSTHIQVLIHSIKKKEEDRCVSRKCSIVLLVMPEEHHKRTILQRLLTLLYIIHHLILRATKFLQEQTEKNMRLNIVMSYNTITIGYSCYGKQFFFSQISPSVTKSNKLSWKFALIFIVVVVSN